MGGHWIVNEGVLRRKADAATSMVPHRAAFADRFFVLYMNRKMEVFENEKKEHRVESFYLQGFSGWDGEGLLKANELYGLELKLEKHAQSRMYVAAYNRLDLEKWCRGFVAVLDPESAAGQEVRRERRKARKEEKRLQEEKEAKIRQWKEQQQKMIEDEKRRLQEREVEILNMTPLERIDGLGSLDEDTARLLEKRKQRLQRRQAPTTRRVNKTAYRQRLEDAAGGRLDNVQPLPTKVVEQRTKVRIEPPPPGQFIEVAGSGRRGSNPARRQGLDFSDSGDDSDESISSRMSSGRSASSFNGGSVPPPPPPPPFYGSENGDLGFIPPPPPPLSSYADSNAEPSMANAFAASLAAIRRNRADTMDETNGDSRASLDGGEVRKARNRTRDSQLSAEGKAILQKAMPTDADQTKSNGDRGRKGLFDDSSEEDGDSDNGLFGVKKTNGATAMPSSSKKAPAKKYAEPSDNGDFSDDSDADEGPSMFDKPKYDITSPRSSASFDSRVGNTIHQRSPVEVVYNSCALQNDGKKFVGVYTFSIRSGHAEHSFTNSYHGFETTHSRFVTGMPGKSVPKFPPKHLLRNNTKPDNMQKRAMEFLEYFRQLVSYADIFENPTFIAELRIPETFLRAVNGSGSTTNKSSAFSERSSLAKKSKAPKSTETTSRAPTNGKSRATGLFGDDDSDSEADSVSPPPRMSYVAPPSQPSPEEEPKRKKKSKASKKDIDVDTGSSKRRDRTRSRNSVASSTNGFNVRTAETEKRKTSDPSAPKIAGLPPRPNLFGGGRGDLLAAIRQGAQLNKVDDKPAAPPAGRGAGIPAASANTPPRPPMNPAGSISEAITNAMAARRIHVEYEDDKSDDSDDDWD
ncbi:hypothetical protein Poli38472_003708 [Pythium oligandrum]|uniref:PX domain-containing protein n=1 Tax=Pythium oligandrum TaxID=41045 RepID=A0A8K1CN44_PYTOL|nr:hypothetical protein Poli38472_003708 [Pythium oligandrum]|eukprot:TMW65943.1 hypothetical protein Poli38472_003708 [Pythium oligandrum]